MRPRGLQGGRKIRFTENLESDLAGATFQAKLVARWRFLEGSVDRAGAEAMVRIRLRDAVEKVTKRYSVHAVAAAQDEATLRVANQVIDQTGVTIAVAGCVRLSVDAASRRLADQRVARRRDTQVGNEVELERLKFFRAAVLTDEALARTWWLLQPPDVVKALDRQLLDEATKSAAEASAKRAASDVDSTLLLLADFARWLDGADRGVELVLTILEKLLEFGGPADLRNRFRQLHPQLGVQSPGIDGIGINSLSADGHEADNAGTARPAGDG